MSSDCVLLLISAATLYKCNCHKYLFCISYFISDESNVVLILPEMGAGTRNFSA